MAVAGVVGSPGYAGRSATPTGLTGKHSTGRVRDNLCNGDLSNSYRAVTISAST